MRFVSRGTHHSLAVQVGDTITIDKDRKWQAIEISILKKSGNNSTFILVAIDAQEAGVAKVSGTHLKIIPNIYSGQSGKRYQQVSKKQSDDRNVFWRGHEDHRGVFRMCFRKNMIATKE